MRKVWTGVLAALLVGACAADGPWFVGGEGGVLLPGNGNALARAAEVSAFAGYHASDFWAWELACACAPNASARGGGEALSGVAARGLFHLTGFEAFDKLFGCERFDPFVTFGAAARFGARHVFAEGARRTACGPTAGIGAFYHLTDSLDLRVDAQAMLGCDAPCGMLYAVGVGLQWNFGGGNE